MSTDKDFKRIFDKVRVHMNWGEAKTNWWFDYENPLLGKLTPRYMFKAGRAAKLERFIDNLIDEAGDPKNVLKGKDDNGKENTN